MKNENESRKSSKTVYTKLLYAANEIYMNPDYKPGEYIKITAQEDVD